MGAVRTRGGQNLTTARWIDRAQTVHGDKYDYSLVEYVDFKTKVAIICIEHGVFEQIPINHVSAGQGCRACAGLALRVQTSIRAYRAKRARNDWKVRSGERNRSRCQ